MEAKGYFILIGLVFALVLAACSKDDSETEKGITRSTAVNDSIENDSTSGGGITITINDEWKGDTMIHF